MEAAIRASVTRGGMRTTSSAASRMVRLWATVNEVMMKQQRAQPPHRQQQRQQEGDVVVADEDVVGPPAQEIPGDGPGAGVEPPALEHHLADAQAGHLGGLVAPAHLQHRPVGAGQIGEQAQPGPHLLDAARGLA